LSGEIVVVCSRADPASLNIFECLLDMAGWRHQNAYLSFQCFRLVVHEGRQTALTGIDDRLADLGLEPELIVFASRHVAKAALPWLGGHFTGVLQEKDASLSAAAPGALRSFLHNIALPGFALSAEATHHGPSDVRTPCFFAEIGSTEREWKNRQAGETVARAILDLQVHEKDPPVFLGFGGGHYVARQTELIFNSGVAFGHLFSNYQIEGVNRDVVEEAIRKSSATYAYLDRKSLRSQERGKLEGILAELNLPVLRSREIRAQFPRPEKV
jgi:D-aminoacyl-tRNA deacylase